LANAAVIQTGSGTYALSGHLPIIGSPVTARKFEQRDVACLTTVSRPGGKRPSLRFATGWQDSLLPIFLATLAVQHKNRTIRFRTAAEMLESFGMHASAKEYRRLVGAFERVFGTTIYFGTNTLFGRATMVQRCRFNFMREAQILVQSGTPSSANPLLGVREHHVLSDEFYQELIANRLPNVLAASSAVLDLFMWLSYRCFTARGPSRYRYSGDFAPARQISIKDYSGASRFPGMVEQWLGTIRDSGPNARPGSRQTGSDHDQTCRRSLRRECFRYRQSCFVMECRVRHCRSRNDYAVSIDGKTDH
jgi:hypothetical protein